MTNEEIINLMWEAFKEGLAWGAISKRIDRDIYKAEFNEWLSHNYPQLMNKTS